MHLVNPKGLSFTHVFHYINLWQHIKKKEKGYGSFMCSRTLFLPGHVAICRQLTFGMIRFLIYVSTESR